MTFTLTAAEQRKHLRPPETGTRNVTRSADALWNAPDLTFALQKTANKQGHAVTALSNSHPTTNTTTNTLAGRGLTAPWQQTTTPLCTRDQLVQGTWVPVRLSRPPYITPTVHLRCHAREIYYRNYYDTYSWKPSSTSSSSQDSAATTGCDFTPWRPTLFCRLMKSATIAIVGDSLSWEHYASLVQLLQAHKDKGKRTHHQGYQHLSKELDTNIQQTACDGQVALVYRRDDRLTRVDHALDQNFPTVLILNRGAHHVNDTAHVASIQQVLGHVQKWLDQCRDLDLPCRFFWRTSVPGHPDCGNFTQPVNDMAAMEALVADRSLYLDDDESSSSDDPRHKRPKLSYQWYDYQHQNELTLSVLQDSGIPFQVIDAYSLNILRPDDHRALQGDCLHNCFPGKMDVYNQLLLHYLRRDWAANDVERIQAVAGEQGWKTNVTTPYDKQVWQEAKRIREAQQR